MPRRGIEAKTAGKGSAAARDRVRRMRREWRDWVAPVVLGVFLCAGWVKADTRLSWLPFDLTAGFAALTILLAVRRVIAGESLVVRGIGWIAALFSMLLLASVNTDWTRYAIEKAERLFTLTLLAALAPAFLVRGSQELGRLLKVLTAIGLLMAADAAYAIVNMGPELLRATATGTDTIETGRSAGVTFLIVLVGYLRRTLPGKIALPLLGGLGVVALASGSRGPLVALSVAGLLTIMALPQGTRHTCRVCMVFLSVVVLTCLSISWIPAGSVERVERLFAGHASESETDRLAYAKYCVEEVPEHPWGIGFGGFAASSVEPSQSYRSYPHNIVLEVALEMGWLAALVLMAAITLGLGSGFRLTRAGQEEAVLFPVLAMLVISALFSSDINGHRLLFAFLSLSIRGSRFWRGQRYLKHMAEAGAREREFAACSRSGRLCLPRAGA